MPNPWDSMAASLWPAGTLIPPFEPGQGRPPAGAHHPRCRQAHRQSGMEDEQMRRSWIRRLEALEARYGLSGPVDPLSVGEDTCSSPPTAGSFDGASPEDRARVVDLEEGHFRSAPRQLSL